MQRGHASEKRSRPAAASGGGGVEIHGRVDVGSVVKQGPDGPPVPPVRGDVDGVQPCARVALVDIGYNQLVTAAAAANTARAIRASNGLMNQSSHDVRVAPEGGRREQVLPPTGATVVDGASVVPWCCHSGLEQKAGESEVAKPYGSIEVLLKPYRPCDRQVAGNKADISCGVLIAIHLRWHATGLQRVLVGRQACGNTSLESCTPAHLLCVVFVARRDPGTWETCNCNFVRIFPSPASTIYGYPEIVTWF